MALPLISIVSVASTSTPQDQKLPWFANRAADPVADQLQSKRGRKLVTILSIDGGGVRGLIASEILTFLESQLQLIDGDEARVAEYFDLIAGTSTGGLIAAMITVPNNEKRPKFSAQDVKAFYIDHSPKIFPFDKQPYDKLKKLVKRLMGPKYNGKHLHQVIKDQFGNISLNETVTNILVPTYDITKNDFVLFTNYEIKTDPSLDARLSDICIGTSAAPTYLPAHFFTNRDATGEVREFNLIDGGVFANNPASLALSAAMRAAIDANEPEEVEFLIISIGTGSGKSKISKKYSAVGVSRWGIIDWLAKFTHCSSPIVDVLKNSVKNWMQVHLSTISSLCRNKCHYFRIQEEGLEWPASSLDISTPENLENLVSIGLQLLDKKVQAVNFFTEGASTSESKSEFGVNGQVTNREELIRFAKVLYNEKKRRARGI